LRQSLCFVTGMGNGGEKIRFWVLHQAVCEFNLLMDQKASIAMFLGHSKFVACCIWHSRSYNKCRYWSAEVKRCGEIACRNVTCVTVATKGCNTERLWPGGWSGAVHRSGGQAPASRRKRTSSIPDQSTWNLCWRHLFLSQQWPSPVSVMPQTLHRLHSWTHSNWKRR